MACDGCRLQVGLPDPVATESDVPCSAPAAGKAALPRHWAARARPRTAAAAAATGYSGRAPRGLLAWESSGRRPACDSSGSAARLDPDLAPPALRPRLRGIPSERVFAAATAGCRRCGGPGSAGFASGSGNPGAGDGALGGGLARKALRRGGAGFTELEVTSWVISPAFPTQHGGLVLPSARLLWQFCVVRDGWLRCSRMQI